ncbi:MAG: sensor histidine kinase [Sandaracinaceae bacterium]|nr:sensor histidine kinase [Sandaracinaceae bacterium]
MSDAPDDAALGSLLGLVAHDLRSPLAVLRANVELLRVTASAEGESRDVLDDCEQALGQLARGLEQLAWIGEAAGAASAPPSPAPTDLGACVRAAVARSGVDAALTLPDAPVERAVSAGLLTVLVDRLVRAAARHGEVRVSLAADGVIEIADRGAPLPAELRASALSARGQRALKASPSGRYVRAGGMYALARLAELARVALELDERDGVALARIRA